MRQWLELLLVGARRHPFAVGTSAAILAAVAAVLISRITFDANILRLLPRRSPVVQDFRLFLEEFGSLDHLYVVFDSPDSMGSHTDLVDAYVKALREAPEIASIDAQLMDADKDWTYLSDRVLFLLGADDATVAMQRFRRPRLDQELLHARDLLSMPSPQIKAYVQHDPLGLLRILRSRMEQQKGAVSFDPSQDGYVTSDGRSRLLIVKPRGAPFDTDFCKTLFRRLTDVESRARAAAREQGDDPSAVTVQSAGAYRISLEAEALIRGEGIVNSIGSLVVLLLIVITVFRTPWMLLLGTIPLTLAAALSLGLNGVVQGSLSPATSGSAGMLFGLGIDGVVLLYVRYLEERQAGSSALEATRGLAGTASSVVLAQATTVATFLALLLLDFPTLQDLGGLVGIGMLLVCPLTLALLPPLLPDRATVRRRALMAPWLGALVVRHSRAILSVGVALTIGLGAAARGLHIDPRLERLQAKTPGVDQERQIARRFSLPLDVLLVLNDSPRVEPLVDADARLRARLAGWDSSMGVSGISVLLPAARIQDEVARAISTSGLDAGLIERDVRASGEQAGFRSGTFDSFFATLPRLVDPNERVTYEGLLSHGLGSVVSRFLVPHAGGFATAAYLFPQRAVDLDALGRTIRDVDPRFRLTGLSVVNQELARGFLPEFGRGIAIGTAAVALLLYAWFRTIRHTLLALVPTIVGFIWSAGLLALIRIELDLFSLFATVTFIGIAVDYGIYVLYRHVFEDDAGVGDVLTRTGPAIAIACLAALVGFGSLVFSAYGPLRVFGLVSVITLSCCLAASLLFLPAVIVRMSPWSRSAR